MMKWCIGEFVICNLPIRYPGGSTSYISPHFKLDLIVLFAVNRAKHLSILFLVINVLPSLTISFKSTHSRQVL
ncbi:Hypothetical predicted protein [Octopus vulgaris]|uniref:Uncharacterized protein n=1 Tax=Octopus vulgaris TaxID=6645 RepID=A0AA36AIG0_OCTVU|nr:Hypothetical predicted protein [Octopus vulgaris]